MYSTYIAVWYTHGTTFEKLLYFYTTLLRMVSFQYMYPRTILLFILLACTLIGGKPFSVFALETYMITPVTPSLHELFTNTNGSTLPHPQIATFSIDASGNAYGYTENGIYFSQYTIPNALGIRIQRFDMEEYHHYIIEGTAVYSLETFSAELAQAYKEHVAV